ncbi:MAG: hypothetical protein AAGG02_07030, partial [Cyanobacteria bacterium P01_H01_bin.15]
MMGKIFSVWIVIFPCSSTVIILLIYLTTKRKIFAITNSMTTANFAKGGDRVSEGLFNEATQNQSNFERSGERRGSETTLIAVATFVR